jgi:adenylate cyclase
MPETKAADPTGRSSGGRKLIAVVHTDMVGYSRLIGFDDVGTLERLRALRRALIDPTITENGGRIVNTGGDSLLMVFDSIEGAVRCAVKVQQQVRAYDGEEPPDRAIRFRVGVNVGDVIPDGTDIHGDVVNVAARLQAECPPGGICVSRAVRDHVQDRLNLAFEELGALDLKNINRPVEAFVLKLDRAMAPTISRDRLLVQNTSEALPLPDKPSIAVLAFTNMSGGLDQEYFSDGIADDIITELSRSRSLFVIARNSSFTYKGHAVDVKQVARELGVRYVVEGSVRRSGDRIRVTAQLIDATTGNHIWAERYDRNVNDVFAVQDEITVAVTTGINPAVDEAERRRALRKQPESLTAWEAYQRGLWHVGKFDLAENERAKAFFRRAIELDAVFAPAYSALALACHFEGSRFATRSLDEATKEAVLCAHKAVAIDPADADAQAVLATATMWTGDRVAAWERASQALARNQNSPWAIGQMAGIALHNGYPAKARDLLFTALRRSPRDPHNSFVLRQITMSYYFERDYTGAAEAAKRALALDPDNPMPYRWLAASLGQLGQTDEAREALQKAIEVSPRTFDVYVRDRPLWFRPVDHGLMLDGLRKAGWQG